MSRVLKHEKFSLKEQVEKRANELYQTPGASIISITTEIDRFSIVKDEQVYILWWSCDDEVKAKQETQETNQL